ncbi:GAF domain protein [Desulfovibrio sp. X2]|uniref:GAF domain-containing protein n=1 Tax=Desulfovibrio sp. X2 TaxID=941449 RepID=UPI000358D485|nr:GAF domain-containing protein [Desulfovibrio sp. X2]EPR42309.1 GAF domain protein [Desulfovibrio sp. X2]
MSCKAINQQLLGIICSVFDAHSAVLFLPEEAGSYSMAASFSLSDKIKKGAVIAPGQGLAGWIIRNREPLLINNFDQKRGVLGYYEGGEESRVRAFMGCPLDRDMGVLCLDSMRTYSFSAKDQKILHQFAQFIVGLAEDRDQRAADGSLSGYYRALQAISMLRTKTPRWTTFIDGFLQIVAEAAGMSTVFLTVRDENGRHYFVEGATRLPVRGASPDQAYPIGNGIIGWVYKNGAPVFSGDRESASSMPLFGKDVVTAPYATLACLPLLVHRRTRGVLVAADERGVPLSDDLKAFLAMATGNLALFLENLYLKNRLTSAAGKE